MGMFGRVGIELPEAGLPIIQPAANWKEVVTLTVGFGHGISVSPLHVVRGTAAIANGGVLMRPTILALPPGAAPGGRAGHAAIDVGHDAQADAARGDRRLRQAGGSAGLLSGRQDWHGGEGRQARLQAGYKENANVAAFMSVFPMNAPRYAVYMMLDEPHGNKSTYGYSTAGWVAAPAAGRVIARIGPMLGMLPDIEDAPTINQALYHPAAARQADPSAARGASAAQIHRRTSLAAGRH